MSERSQNEKPIEHIEWPTHQARCERCRASSDGTNLCEDGAAILRLEGDNVVLRVRLATETEASRAIMVTATLEYMHGAEKRGGKGGN